jgi:hypothetical protein
MVESNFLPSDALPLPPLLASRFEIYIFRQRTTHYARI